MVASTVALSPPSQSSIVAYVKKSVINQRADIVETLDAVRYASINNMIPYYWTDVLTELELIQKICESKPVIVLRGWMLNNGERDGGHYVVIYKVQFTATGVRFRIRDPWPVNTGATHTWTYNEIVNGRSTGMDTGLWEASITR